MELTSESCWEFRDGDWHELPEKERSAALLDDSRWTWLDLQVVAPGDDETLELPERLQELAGHGYLKRLNADRAMRGGSAPPHEPPRVRAFSGWVFARLYWLWDTDVATHGRSSSVQDATAAQEVHLFLMRSSVVTLRYPALRWPARDTEHEPERIAPEQAPAFPFGEIQDEFAEAWELQIEDGLHETAIFGLELACTFVKRTVSTYLMVLEHIRQSADEVETLVMNRGWLWGRFRHSAAREQEELETELLGVQRMLRRVRWAFLPEDEIEELQTGPFANHHDHVLDVRFADSVRETRRARETLAEITEQLSTAFQLMNALKNDRLNRTMYVLTVVATTLLVPTLIAGIYGMNFHNMPELRWRFGYFDALALMVVVVALTLGAILLYLRWPARRLRKERRRANRK